MNKEEIIKQIKSYDLKQFTKYKLFRILERVKE